MDKDKLSLDQSVCHKCKFGHVTVEKNKQSIGGMFPPSADSGEEIENLFDESFNQPPQDPIMEVEFEQIISLCYWGINKFSTPGLLPIKLSQVKECNRFEK